MAQKWWMRGNASTICDVNRALAEADSCIAAVGVYGNRETVQNTDTGKIYFGVRKNTVLDAERLCRGGAAEIFARDDIEIVDVKVSDANSC